MPLAFVRGRALGLFLNNPPTHSAQVFEGWSQWVASNGMSNEQFRRAAMGTVMMLGQTLKANGDKVRRGVVWSCVGSDMRCWLVAPWVRRRLRGLPGGGVLCWRPHDSNEPRLCLKARRRQALCTMDS